MENDKDKGVYIRDKLRISIIFNIILFTNLFVFMCLYSDSVNKNNLQQNTINQLQSDLNIVTEDRDAIIVSKDKTIELLTEDIYTIKDTYTELYDTSLQVNELNKDLLTDNHLLENEMEKQFDELTSYIDALETKLTRYEEFDVFMFDPSTHERTDCSYELLEYLEGLIKDKAIDNLPFYCSWIMIESHWDNHDQSNRTTALGLPQFLDSTGKWVYEDLMEKGRGTYNHKEMVVDPYISLEMMVVYVERLIDKNNGDLYKTIDGYRGLHDEEYYRRFNKYLAYFDLDVDTLAKEFKVNYNKINNGD